MGADFAEMVGDFHDADTSVAVCREAAAVTCCNKFAFCAVESHRSMCSPAF